mgnify:CR=1 FL=1|jgi:serine/threonine protein kinase
MSDIGQPIVIGQGSFGCVHKPQMKCEGKNRTDASIVSKLMKRNDANDELKEFSLIDMADNKQEYYLGIPQDCNIDNQYEMNVKAISNCTRFDATQINNYKLLLMKYGGQDLQAFGEHVHKWKKTSNNIKKLELFWLEVSRLFRGLNAFNKAGVVHHDLKHPNIVYDEKSHRINFIDFGFMSKKNDIIKNCKASDYWLSKQLHWSFPFEIILWNKDTYSKYATGAASKLAKDFSDASLDMSKPTGYFFTTITDFKPNTPEYKRISENMFKQFFKMSMELDMKGYDDFLNKSIDTIDSYGVGIALMFMLRKSKHLLNRKFSEKAFNLFQNMIHPNVYSRHNTNVLMNEYEVILSEHGFLTNHNMRFDNHRLVPGNEFPISIEKTINKMVTDTNQLSKDDIKAISLNDEPIRKCPEGKEYKPHTKRCVNTCKIGYKRDDNFKCVRDKTRKTIKKCPPGKKLNLDTNRCIKICKPGFIHNDNHKCRKLKGNPFD